MLLGSRVFFFLEEGVIVEVFVSSIFVLVSVGASNNGSLF